MKLFLKFYKIYSNYFFQNIIFYAIQNLKYYIENIHSYNFILSNKTISQFLFKNK